MLGPQVDPKDEAPVSQADFKSQETLIKELQQKVLEQETMCKNILQKYKQCKEEKEHQIQTLHQMIHKQVIRQGCQVQHYEEKIQNLSKELQKVKDETTEYKKRYDNVAQHNEELKESLDEARRISEQKSSSLGQAKIREMHLLRKLQQAQLQMKQECENVRNALLKENRLRNEHLLQLEAERNVILRENAYLREQLHKNPNQLDLLQCENEIQRLKILLQQVDSHNRELPVLRQIRVPVTPQEEGLSSVIFGQPRPTTSANEFICIHSCVVLSLSFVCHVNNIRVCPLCVVKIATHIAGQEGDLSFDKSILFNCEKTIDLFTHSKLLWHVKSNSNIHNIITLNKALIDVTSGCPDEIGLLAFEYHHQSIGHCLVFKKRANELEIYDPQKCDWWHEEDYNTIKTVHCFQVNIKHAALSACANCVLTKYQVELTLYGFTVNL